MKLPPHNIFTPDHAAALRTVDLEINGRVHGTSADYDFGPNSLTITRHVTDNDYTEADNWVETFDPAKGDRLAVERYGYDEAPELEDIAYRDTGVRVVTPRNKPRERAEEVLEVSAHLHTMSPFTYAVGKALLRGMDVQCADMNESQRDNYEATIEEIVAGAPRVLRGAYKSMLAERLKVPLRNWYVLARLGEIAADIPQDAREVAASQGKKPKLGFLVGSGHALHLSQTLRAAEVPHINTRNVYTTVASNTLSESIATAAYVLVGYDTENRHVRQIKQRWAAIHNADR